MNKIANLSLSGRKDLFNETAARMDLDPVIIEKDFWVCWILKQIFSMSEFSGRLVFKGGTSLSKCFHLIQRFSEDVDIAVNFEKLGFVNDRDPRRVDLSYTKRASLLKELMSVCHEYIQGEFFPILMTRIKEILPENDWQLQVNPRDSHIVEFEYPSSLDSGLDYIKPQVVLELGTHADPVPNENCNIISYAADHFPGMFSFPTCSVATVVARRTFWEKATILHAEYYRPIEKPMLPRYSRHYADVAQMSMTPIVDEALEDIDLLKSVTTHKDMFYHCGWAKYNLAVPGSLRLVPPDNRLSSLQRDYHDMAAMFFSEPPEWDDILEKLSALEKRINC